MEKPAASLGHTYRADVDGLRAVAVLPVVLYHAKLPGFSGGYVGVDVFFVISGYLITGILLDSLTNDTFSIVDFYKRRVRRIFPALLLVCAATLALAWLFLMPEHLIELARSLIYVVTFSSNLYFWKAVSYFDAAADLQPLLHTWSLAVEEQFYIFYPLLLYFAARTKVRVDVVLLAVGGLSLMLACVLISRAPSAVFYLLPARAWELMIGGLIACGYPRRVADRRVNVAAGAAGLALILLPVFLYDADTLFPAFTALPPTLGAAMLIWSGSGPRGPVHAALASAPAVLIGKASYSFYLWHFPLFALAAYLHGGELPIVWGLGLSLLSLLLALATLHLLETPVRKSRHPMAVTGPLAGMILLGVGTFIMARSDGYPGRLPPQAGSFADAALDKDRQPGHCMSVDYRILPPAQACRLGYRPAAPSVLLWGDSHAVVAATAVEAAARRHRASFLFAAAADCPIGLGFGISDATHPNITTMPAYRFCARYNREMFELAAADPNIRAVVLASRWTNWRVGEPGNPIEAPVDIRLEDARGTAASASDNARIFEAGLRRLVERLNAAGKRVYLVGPVAEPPVDVPQTLFVARFGLEPMPQAVSIEEFERRHATVLAIFSRVSRVAPMTVIWPHTVLCRAGRCPVLEGSKPMYHDHNHLSVYGALKTSPLYDPIFAQLETPPKEELRPPDEAKPGWTG